MASPVYYVLDSSEYWIVASNRFSEAPRQMTLRRVENDHYARTQRTSGATHHTSKTSPPNTHDRPLGTTPAHHLRTRVTSPSAHTGDVIYFAASISLRLQPD